MASFNNHFEQGEDHYLYRRNLQGRAVKISLKEFEKIAAGHDTASLKTAFLTVVVWALTMAALCLAEAFLNRGDTNGIAPDLSFPIAAAYAFGAEDGIGTRSIGKWRAEESLAEAVALKTPSCCGLP
jgi:hypothetical protein